MAIDVFGGQRQVREGRGPNRLGDWVVWDARVIGSVPDNGPPSSPLAAPKSVLAAVSRSVGGRSELLEGLGTFQSFQTHRQRWGGK